jgi:hypothetical protein
VITGFNTDIKHAERVFHVQTEDRGTLNPVVESLVYVGGEILLSKKRPYGDMVENGRTDEQAVRQMMDSQHRLIIEAIKRGRFDGAKPGDPAPLAAAVDEALSPLSPAAAAATAAILSAPAPVPVPVPARAPDSRGPSAPLVPSALPIAPKAAPPALPPRAPAPASRMSGSDEGPPRSLDQVIIDYLAAEAASERLEITFSRVTGDLVAGSSCTILVKAATSLTGRPVAGASITIRVVTSTAAPPSILFRGVTGDDGLVRAALDLPQLGNANAAVIVAGNAPIGRHEAKQFIRKN